MLPKPVIKLLKFLLISNIHKFNSKFGITFNMPYSFFWYESTIRLSQPKISIGFWYTTHISSLCINSIFLICRITKSNIDGRSILGKALFDGTWQNQDICSYIIFSYYSFNRSFFIYHSGFCLHNTVKSSFAKYWFKCKSDFFFNTSAN